MEDPTHEEHGSRAGKVLFHLALAAGAVPVLGLPVVLLAAISARGEAADERGRRWARRIAMVLVLDVLASLVVAATIAGVLPPAGELTSPVPRARIGIVADERDDAMPGVPVAAVLEGGPASIAGLAERDVILSIGGVGVDDAEALRLAIEAADRGARSSMATPPITMEVRRGESVRTLEIVPAHDDALSSGACSEIAADDVPRPSTGTLVSYGVMLLGTALLALLGWRRGVGGGVWVWPPFVTIPAIGAVAGAGAALLACRVGAEDLVLESALIGSELVLVMLGGLAVWASSRGRAAPGTWLEDTPLATSRTVVVGVFYIATWIPRVLVLSSPLFFLAHELGLEGASDTLGAVLGGDRTPLALALTFVAGAVLAPIGEELVFRGLLLPHLARIVAPWTAIAISALLFGALHEAHGVARVGPMAIGAILGWARLRSGTLRAPIAIHMFVNATALSIAWLAG